MGADTSTLAVTLPPESAGWRLDRALAAALPQFSRERLKTLISSGAVDLGRDPAKKVTGGEALTVSVPEAAPAAAQPQDIPLTIVFEDDHLLVVDKPAGSSSIRQPATWTARSSMRYFTTAPDGCRGSVG